MSIRLRLTNDELVKAKHDAITYKKELDTLKENQPDQDGRTKVITRTIIK